MGEADDDSLSDELWWDGVRRHRGRWGYVSLCGPQTIVHRGTVPYYGINKNCMYSGWWPYFKLRHQNTTFYL
jgi:hypothetical protein